MHCSSLECLSVCLSACPQLACWREPLCPLSTLCFLTWHLRAPRAGPAETAASEAGHQARLPGSVWSGPMSRAAPFGKAACGSSPASTCPPRWALGVGVSQPGAGPAHRPRGGLPRLPRPAPRPRQSKLTADPTRPHLQPGPSGLPPHAPGGSGSRQSVEGRPAPERPAVGPPGGGLQGLPSRGTGVHLGRPRGLCPPGCVSG